MRTKALPSRYHLISLVFNTTLKKRGQGTQRSRRYFFQRTLWPADTGLRL